MKKKLALFFGVIITQFLVAQNLNGIWRGTLKQAPGGCFQNYNIELKIELNGSKITGTSYHYSDFTNYVKEEFEGTYDREKKFLTINENKIVTFHVPPECIPCIKQFYLNYTKQGKQELLTGTEEGTTMNNFTNCPSGIISLTKVAESDFSHIKEIKVDTGIIRLQFYDNAQIDGDTISVLLNNQPLVVNQRLSAKPIILEIKVDPNNLEQEITMVGENQGSIPPNTALLIVIAGKKRYQLYLSSTENKNAQVRFIYEKQLPN